MHCLCFDGDVKPRQPARVSTGFFQVTIVGRRGSSSCTSSHDSAFFRRESISTCSHGRQLEHGKLNILLHKLCEAEVHASWQEILSITIPAAHVEAVITHCRAPRTRHPCHVLLRAPNACLQRACPDGQPVCMDVRLHRNSSAVARQFCVWHR